jgi:hypothetical protein
MEKRILLTETTFTNLCKNGFVKYESPNIVFLTFTKGDIQKLISGAIVEKSENEDVYKFLLQDLGTDLIIEILRRSPIYSDLSYTL